MDQHKEARGNLSWKCNFCQKHFKSSYTRVRAHLLKISGKGVGPCLKVTTRDLWDMQKLDEEATARINSNVSKLVPLPPSSYGKSSSIDLKKRPVVYYSEQWLNEDPTRVPPHNPTRVPPHKDMEINQERTKCIRKYFPNLEERNKVNMEYAEFVGKNGDFRDFGSIENRYAMDPKAWWVLHGACAPMLQTIALRLLAQPSSSSCAERNWSFYSFVHSMKRNKMTPKRAEGLVYIHSNLRLLSRKSPQYAQEVTQMWDIGGDAFDSQEDIGVLEVASLSLDESEIESIVFLDEVDAPSDGGHEDNNFDEV
ncbi:Dimer_Tnp_hAT domain-containing protein [Cephalotus follicularis]|uniref:Dimer_Tnp_hAT domain-containing protein n=1 Tax=Cephalotus follicularis TaxID=3775 RepID=A0A1Q3CJ75_CEPFO|nr:Dimer_Tnp_hAT domain-containing protein [Cephalotus follicularis]